MSLRPFLGLWVFDPTVSTYPAGAPEDARYAILRQGDGLVFRAEWVEAGERKAATFHELFDDNERDFGDTGHRMRGWVEDGALCSEIRTSTGGVHKSVRRLVDGDLVIEQTSSEPNAGSQTTVGVYRKQRVKQVLLYRRDLKMRKGKIAAQCSHASLAVFSRGGRPDPFTLQRPLDAAAATWFQLGAAKIVLSVDDEQALVTAHEAARAAGLPTVLITDSGRTEFKGVPTQTAVAIGPAAGSEIDRITGKDGLVQAKLA